MTNDVFILTRIIEREGMCIGIDCKDCHLDSHVINGYAYPSCNTTDDPGTYAAAKAKLLELDPSLLFEMML